MLKIPLPTDNFYKTLFFLGLSLFAVSLIPMRPIHKLNVDIIRLTGEVGELEMRKVWLANDSNGYEKGVNYLEKYKQWKPGMIQALNPGTEEAKMYTEMTGDTIEPGIAELVISLDSPKEIEEKKNKNIAELQSAIDTANNKLKVTRRELKENETKLKTKDRELLKIERFVKYEVIFARISWVIGICLLLIGGFKWVTITQKYENAILKNQSGK
jgi:hypothetical protein